MPDTRGYGIFWVDRETLAAAYDMQGAFNRVAIKLAPGASEQAAVDGVARLLAPYGGREAHGRTDQPSHAMLDNEIKEQRVLGTVLPAIFLAVAAFLLNVVVSRLVATQREQIAALKALGYPDRRDRRRTTSSWSLLIVAVGLALGLVRRRLAGRDVHGPVRRVLPLPELRASHRAVAAGRRAAASRSSPRSSARSTRSSPRCACRRPRRCGRPRRAATERTLLERLGIAGDAGRRCA